MTNLNQGRATAAIRQFLATRKVLIADPSATIRTGLFKIFQDLGSKTSDILLTNNFNQALSLIASEKPQVVIAEYELGPHCGLELFQTQRELQPAETKNSIFVIITGNTSQTAVARAAEEDIDAYILKPYTIENVRKTLIQAAVHKLMPSGYYLEIENGKKLLMEGKYKEAEQHFEQATHLDPTPSLAFYYLGFIKYSQKILGDAQGKYKNGLHYNRIHYKCMVGLYELFMAEKDYERAYDIVKRISRYFPANPKRLSEVLHLAIVTKQYDDIEKYYAIFTHIDARDENLIRYVCASLIVCGKYYLSIKVAQSRAIELFKKASVTGQGRTNILKEIIVSLIDYNQKEHARYFLARFPAETMTSNEYLLCQFLINSSGASTASLLIDDGRALLAKGVIDQRLYTTMIESSIENKLNAVAENYIYEAIKHFPNQKEHFERFLKKTKVAEKSKKGSLKGKKA